MECHSSAGNQPPPPRHIYKHLLHLRFSHFSNQLNVHFASRWSHIYQLRRVDGVNSKSTAQQRMHLQFQILFTYKSPAIFTRAVFSNHLTVTHSLPAKVLSD